MRNDHGDLRILAIDPTHKGFGYVVTEGESLLVDWGVAHVRGPKHSGCLRRLGELVELYTPDLVVIENPTVDSRRWARVRLLLQNIRAWGDKRGVRVRMLSRRRVRNVFAEWNANTKEEIASVIALRFPELAFRLPPHRKCYMSEDARMSIFDAAALAITVVASRKPRPVLPSAVPGCNIGQVFPASPNNKGTPGESRGRKATGPRLLRDAGLQASY